MLPIGNSLPDHFEATNLANKGRIIPETSCIFTFVPNASAWMEKIWEQKIHFAKRINLILHSRRMTK